MKLFGKEITIKKLLKFAARAPKYASDWLSLQLLCFLLPLILRCNPEILSFIIGNKSESRYLPRSDERLELTDDPLDDFYCIPANHLCFDEVNLVFRGKSLDHRKIDKSMPTFFVNLSGKNDFCEYKLKWLATSDLRIFARNMGVSENQGFYKKKSDHWSVHFTAGYRYLEGVDDFSASSVSLSEGQSGIYKALASRNIDIPNDAFDCSIVIHRSLVKNLQLGSGVYTVIALLAVSHKINIYGWDQYCDSELPRTYYAQVRSLCKKKNLSKGNVITSLTNWIYAYRIMECYSDRVTIDGQISAVKDFEWIPKRAYSILYKV